MLTVNSEPPGAKIYLNSEYKGLTPSSFKIKRKLDSYQVLLKADGFEDFHTNVENRLNLCDPLGWIIDVASGSVMKYDEAVYYQLERTALKVSMR